LGLPESNRLRIALVSSGDFYNISGTRDLLFHVQEHRLDLIQIEEMLEQLGLQCVTFLLDNPQVADKFDKMFPEDVHRSNLLNWHAFEKEFPDTFAGTYQFWCQKGA
jgi:hypothetical protein